jgi:hypothetical protein
MVELDEQSKVSAVHLVQEEAIDRRERCITLL